MLRPSQLRKHLSYITQGQIQATLIATRSGEFLDYVVKNNDEKAVNVKSLCAVICSIYQSYQKFSVSLSDNLNFVILDCDQYRMAIKPVGNHIVCICADANIGLGVLKLKMNSLSENLSNLLTNVPVY
jgi:predicted regulator of Ras-like GTPase activity (Roadblock/LC7/MglB family)